MEIKRKPFQGVVNIVRFNWHFYVISGLSITVLLGFQHSIPGVIRPFAVGSSILALLIMMISLIVSHFIYDRSNLYALPWLPDADFKKVLHITAGFDETSAIIQAKFPNINMTLCDFYDEKKHTEISIQRARSAFQPPKRTMKISTQKLPFDDDSFDDVYAILSAHEIRNNRERVDFFKELQRVTRPAGHIYVTEHLRDWKNFMAYNIGFLHFHTRSTWYETFALAGLSPEQEIKTTPFITTFILSKHGDTP